MYIYIYIYVGNINSAVQLVRNEILLLLKCMHLVQVFTLTFLLDDFTLDICLAGIFS